MWPTQRVLQAERRAWFLWHLAPQSHTTLHLLPHFPWLTSLSLHSSPLGQSLPPEALPQVLFSICFDPKAGALEEAFCAERGKGKEETISSHPSVHCSTSLRLKDRKWQATRNFMNKETGHVMETPITSKLLRELRQSSRMIQDTNWKTKGLSPEPAVQ